MAKAYLSAVLEQTLGKYVNGISSDSHSVGLWKGDVVLKHLTLKPEAITAFLDIPYHLLESTIEKVHIVVPWNALNSKSI